MRLREWIALATLGTCVAGCLPMPSLYPLVESGEGLEVPGLVGDWGDSTDAIRITRTAAGDYVLRDLGPDSSSGDFKARFARIDGRLFADFRPDLGSPDRLIDVSFSWPLHMIFRVEFAGDSLRLAFLDDEWVAGAVRRGRLKVRHEEPEGELILTEKPPGLRKMVGRIANEPAAFDTTGGFLRRR
jgi:hypothetical protein